MNCLHIHAVNLDGLLDPESLSAQALDLPGTGAEQLRIVIRPSPKSFRTALLNPISSEIPFAALFSSSSPEDRATFA